MSRTFKTLSYEELPSFIAKEIDKKSFLSSFFVDEVTSIVVWVIDESTGKQKELEFSVAENRALSLDDRKDNLPSPQKVLMTECGVEVMHCFYFEEITNVLYDEYRIHSINTGDEITSATQIFFSKYKESVPDIVRQALDDNDFPSVYASWEEPQKINYWVSVLYRMRRQSGESGGLEDDIFSPELINSMKKVDKDILRLMPYCLMQLADMEQLEKRELFSIFGKKTGMQL